MRKDAKWLAWLGCSLIMVWSLGLVACGDDSSDSSSGDSNAATSNGTSSSNGATSNGTSASNGATSNGTSSSNGATSNGTTATSNGTTATSNGTTATSNGNTSNGNTSNGSTCDPDACDSADVTLAGNPLFSFEGCCADSGQCGVDVTPAESILGIGGCIEVMRPGDIDDGCESVELDIMDNAVTLPGCCDANNMCGVALDVTNLGSGLGVTGPDFGCQDPSPFDEEYVSMACP